MASDNLEGFRFMIGEKPYCYWDYELKSRTKRFLEAVDTEYFAYLGDTQAALLDGEHKLRTALTIRTAYAQSLETFFAFLCAAIQAPYAIPVWLTKYQYQDVKDIVDRIQHGTAVFTSYGHIRLSWKQVADLVHENLILSDKEKEDKVKSAFADLWSRFAQDFTNDIASREYNSMKHGFRVKAGGFSLALGLEETPGVPAPAEKMQLLGKSDFGSSFPLVESISSDKEYKHHVYVRQCSLNWNPEDMIYGLHALSSSLSNVISYLRVKNGVNAEDVVFTWFSDKDMYAMPWRNRSTLGVRNMIWTDGIVHEEDIDKFTKEDIKNLYKKKPPEPNS